MQVRANRELVDLEPVPEDDALELEGLITEHLARTGSAVAASVLDSWPETLREFVRVIPREYKRALIERARAGDPKTAEFRTLAA